MTIIIPYAVLSAAAAAILGVTSGLRGAPLVGLLLLGFLGAFVAFLLLSVLFVALFSLFVDVRKPQETRSPFYARLVSFVMGGITVFSRIRLHVSGLEKLPAGRWLLVGNHRSSYDPIVTGWALRRQELAFVSKPENMRLPVVGRLLHKCCYLGIDRGDDRAALRTILRAAELLRRDVTSFGIYPEGTRNRTAELLPFRCGAFKIAQKAGVPIVAAAIRGTDDVRRRFPWHRTDVWLEICGVMDAETVQTMKTTEIGEVIKTWITSASC